MHKRVATLTRVLSCGLLLTMAALPAAAETYAVKLAGGNSLVTRYQPRQASWDKNVVLVLTDVGNWIALERGDIESIEMQGDLRGFGIKLDAKTTLLGYSANDVMEREGNAFGNNPLDQFIVGLQKAFGLGTNGADQPQFVEPGDAGGGIPLNSGSFNLFTTGGGGGGGGGTGGGPANGGVVPPDGSSVQ